MGMLVLLVVTAVIVWFVISDPVASPSEAPTPSPVTSGAPAGPPSDLGKKEIWLGEIEVGADIVALPDSTLLDVTAQGYGARSRADGIVVDHLEVRATVSFTDVESQLGGDSRIRRSADGQAKISRTVKVLGRQISVVATGTVEVQNGLLVVEPSSVDLGGPDFVSKATAELVRELVTIEYAVEGLPPNLVLRDVSTEEDGFRAELAGNDVVLAES